MPHSRKCSRPGGKARAIIHGPDYCSVHRPGGVPGGGAPRGTLKALNPGLYARKLAERIQDLKPFWTSLIRSLVGSLNCSPDSMIVMQISMIAAQISMIATPILMIAAQISMIVFSQKKANVDIRSTSTA
jgi:hypothetical protein